MRVFGEGNSRGIGLSLELWPAWGFPVLCLSLRRRRRRPGVDRDTGFSELMAAADPRKDRDPTGQEPKSPTVGLEREGRGRRKGRPADGARKSPGRRRMGPSLAGLRVWISLARGSLRVRQATVQVTLGTEDAARTAMLCGYAWALAGMLLPCLPGLSPRDAHVAVHPSYARPAREVRVDVELATSFWRLALLTGLWALMGWRQKDRGPGPRKRPARRVLVPGER
jgi:hypothetical protein